MQRIAFAALACFALCAPIAAAAAPVRVPQSFPAATTQLLPNGALVSGQTSPDTPLVGVNIFLPAGVAQQPTDRSGVAGVTAAMVLATRVESDRTLSGVATDLGASLGYTIEPQATRFSIECDAADLPRLLGDLRAALKNPDPSALGPARAAALRSARDAIADPAMTAYAMIRESQFAGTSLARLDQGEPQSLAAISSADVAAFAAQYRHGHGTVVALSGDVTPADVNAASSAFADFPSTAAPAGPAPPKPRAAQVVAHRTVAAPWVAVGFAVPSQFSPDFAAMLVIESLLGGGGDVHAFSFGSAAAMPDDFVGGYYQYEAEPGLLVEFYNGAGVEDELGALDRGVTRLRSSMLPSSLVDQAKANAAGTFLTSVATLDDESWMLGRAAASPAGPAYENELPVRIASVTPADVLRVAKKYLGTETIAFVLPGQSRE